MGSPVDTIHVLNYNHARIRGVGYAWAYLMRISGDTEIRSRIRMGDLKYGRQGTWVTLCVQVS